MANGSVRGRDGLTPEQIRGQIVPISELISTRLRNKSYSFTAYREYLRSKGANRNPRIISIPTARDRITLRCLANLIGVVYPEAKGELAQTKVDTLAKALSRNHFDYYIRLDIKNFYPSIRHDIVLRALRKRIRKEEILDVFEKALRVPTVTDREKSRSTNPCGIPQGLSISNLLAELVMQPVDKVFHGQNCIYLRFVDDVLILCSEQDAEALATRAIKAINAQELAVHPLEADRTGKSARGLVAGGFSYLGYVFQSDNIVTVRPASVHKLEESLARVFTRYREHARANPNAALDSCTFRVNLIVTGCIFGGSPRGWILYYRQMNDLELVKRLDSTIRKLSRRFDLPPSFAPKTFMKAYWAAQYPRGKYKGYIPTYDNLTPTEMGGVLARIIGQDAVDEIPPSRLRWKFMQVMNRVTAELDRDIGSTS